MLFPVQCSQNHLQLASLGNLLPPRDQPNTWPRSTIDTDSEHEHPVEDDNNDTLTFTMGLSMHSGRAVRVTFFFHKVRKTLINLIEALCFTKWD